MKKLLLFIIIFFVYNTHAQQVEFSGNLGYWFDNIADYDSSEDRSVIGKGLGNINYGISGFYYFKKPSFYLTTRIGAHFKKALRGSKSEVNPGNNIEFDATMMGATVGIVREVDKNFILYFDAGLSYNNINADKIYDSSEPFLESFPKLTQELYVKDKEISFMYDIGFESHISSKIKYFLELNGDAGISKINDNSGNYRTQALGLGTGIKYILSSK